jgi:hypothetical protein
MVRFRCGPGRFLPVLLILAGGKQIKIGQLETAINGKRNGRLDLADNGNLKIMGKCFIFGSVDNY